MHQSKFSYLSTIKSSSAKKKNRKKLVEHWSLKQMIFFAAACWGAVVAHEGSSRPLHVLWHYAADFVLLILLILLHHIRFIAVAAFLDLL